MVKALESESLGLESRLNDFLVTVTLAHLLNLCKV